MTVDFIEEKYLFAYRDAGFGLIELEWYAATDVNPDHRGKKPVQPNWTKNAIYGADITKERFYKCGAGMVIPKGIMAADVDVRNYAVDEEGGVIDSMDKLRDETGIDLRDIGVVCIETGGGGYHFLFKIPDDIKVVNELPEYPGIEFKSEGRQIVIAGSMHKSGKMYDFSWDSLGLDAIPDAPEKLVEMIQRKKRSFDDVDKSMLCDSRAAVAQGVEALKFHGPAVQGQGGDEHTYKMACILRDFGLSPEKTLELMLEWNESCIPSWTVDELQDKVRNAYTYAQNEQGANSAAADFNTTDKPDGSAKLPTQEAVDAQAEELWDWKQELKRDQYGRVQKTFYNVLLFFKFHPKLAGIIAFDDFNKDIVFIQPAPWHDRSVARNWPEFGGVSWSEYDTIHAKTFFNRLEPELSFDPESKMIYEALIQASHENTINPVKDWFNGLKWDGVKRLDTWLSVYAGAEDNAYTRAVGRKTLLAAVTRVFEPGAKFDQFPILLGEQGTGKSTLVRLLAPHPVLFSDASPDIHSKDWVLCAEGKLILEIAELTNYKKAESEAQKHWLSRRDERFRRPYARKADTRGRWFIMIGTSNDLQLIDPTGSRRKWPVMTSQIDLEGFARDVQQLWAEAMVLYKRGGEPLYLANEEEQRIASAIQEDYFENDEWEDTVRSFLDGEADAEDGTKAQVYDKVSSKDIWERCFIKSINTVRKDEQWRLGSVMTKLGWERCKLWDDGKTYNGYRRK